MTAIALPSRGRVGWGQISLALTGRVGRGLPALLYLGLAALLFGSVWPSPTTLQAGAGGDPQLVLWLLRWFPYALQHGQMPLLTTHLDYPAGVNLMWNTAFVPLAALVAPLTLGPGPVLASNVLLVLCLGLSGWCAFLAIRRYTNSWLAAFLGGVLYGFSPFMVAQALGHPQMTAAFTPPLMLIALDELIVRQRRRVISLGLALGVLGAIQLLIAEEVLATEALVATLGVALLVGMYPGQLRIRAPFVLRGLAVAGVAIIVLTGFPLAVQFFGPQQVHGSIWGQRLFVSDLLGFIVPTPMQGVRPPFADAITQRFSTGIYEWDAYLGWPLIAVLVVVARRAKDNRLIQFATLMLISVAALSMGPVIHVAGLITPVPVALFALVLPVVAGARIARRWLIYPFIAAWAGLTLLPVLNQALPDRLMLYAFLFAGLLFAIFIGALPRLSLPKMRALGNFPPDENVLLPRMRGRAGVVGWATVALVIVSLIPRLPYPAEPVTVPAFFATAAAHRIPEGSVALIAPYSRQWRAEAMVWQAASGMRFRMPEGDAIVPGPSLSPPSSALGSLLAKLEGGAAAVPPPEAMRSTLMADLRHWDVRTVIVGPMDGHEAVAAMFTWLLERPAETVGGVDVWWDISA
ncbi:MAG TPA: hypothetical protein VJT14_02115 [Candidatus Dormibacteraeota bacterium]|nr:hypothetical protein [Candidatus Dormibacteraeota bacterium]